MTVVRLGILRASAWLVVTFSFLVGPGQRATAQEAATLNAFRAAPTPTDDFHLSRPTDQGHQRFAVQAHADYANDPLIFEADDGQTWRVVAHQLNVNLAASLGLLDRVVAFAGLPIVAVMEGDSERSLRDAGLITPDGPGVGDVYLGARVRILGDVDELFMLGGQVVVTLPTGGGERFRGEDFLTFRPEMLAELHPGGGARVVGNLGALVRRNGDTTGSNLAFSDELSFGVGGAIPVWTHDDPATHLDLLVQMYGASAFNDFFAADRTVFEATIGAKVFHAQGISGGLALGPGLVSGFGSPDLRLIATVGYAQPVALPPPPAQVGDSDGDGLFDDVDPCPHEPEDVDGHEDDNGCPDPDNDLDGTPDRDDQCPVNAGPFENGGCPDTDGDGDHVVDRLDRCPEDAEDLDNFEDADGCPDPDNDGDGVVDASDRCPDEAGVVANGGCPDTDRDGDTVVDRLDNCPEAAGSPENQGCPNKQLVRIEEGRLDILDVVYFQTNKDVIERRSFALLMNIASVVNAHPEIPLVRVEGHTDARGNAEKNRDLSRRRAEAVVRFLVEQGSVPERRLVARGFGPDRPIVENARRAADHARNRRVEFNLGAGAEDSQ